MIKKTLGFVLTALLLVDIAYSFLQHYSMPFDGDMAGGIVPAKDVKPVLENPFGIKVFTEHVTYPNPNKFFAHWFFYEYFNKIPLFLQNFTCPINSAYLSCALAKIIFQIMIISLLSFLISGSVFGFNFLLAAFLITPLFQTNGYRSYMGIIDPATTYTFFYALPTIFILIYFTPLFFQLLYNSGLKQMKYLKYLWLPLSIICSLSGPLNPGISLIISVLIFTYHVSQNSRKLYVKNGHINVKLSGLNMPVEYYFYLIPICVFSLYSLFLARYNSINDLNNTLSLSDLYLRLPMGIYYLFTQKPGFPVLFLMLIINTLIIRYKFPNHKGKELLNIFKYIGLFALIYILLLPLGGYRNYRFYILRYDVIIPITLSLMFIYAKTTMFILYNFSKQQNSWYIPLIIIVAFIFTYADKPEFSKNRCERDSILKISVSKESIVKVDNNCTVLSWTIINKPEESALQMKLLKIWRIINEDKLFFQESSNSQVQDSQ